MHWERGWYNSKTSLLIEYEEAFDVFTDEEDFIVFNNIGKYFESLNLQATAGEICCAAEAVLNGRYFSEI